MAYVGDRVREVRESRGWSQRDLAILSGVAQSSISKIEAGGECRGITRMKLAHALEVSSEWLRTGEGSMLIDGELPSISANQADYPTTGGASRDDELALIEEMRWMMAQPDLAKVREMTPDQIQKARQERGDAMVDPWHQRMLRFRIHEALNSMGKDLPEAKRSAVLEACWEEGGGWGTSPDDDQLIRYIKVALA